ncbi:hypothetical protein AMECASPLE_009680 [Ameca splendens]|uniref:Uncharacterized protein n=1 Tax=Ameca splendens TaxID=208324 RepID=A0ABV0YY91_9TELE
MCGAGGSGSTISGIILSSQISLPTHQITSRQCKPPLYLPVFSLSLASLCFLLNSSPSQRDRDSQSPASFKALPVSYTLKECFCTSLNDLHHHHFLFFSLIILCLPFRSVHHDRSLHLHRPLPCQ